MKIAKFGGSSLKSPNHIRRCAQIFEQEGYESVVVSAIGKTTQKLLNIFRGDEGRSSLQDLMDDHQGIAKSLTSDEIALQRVQHLLKELSEFAARMPGTPWAQDYFLSFGERLSAVLFLCAAPRLQHLDARRLMKTDDHFGAASPLWDFSDAAFLFPFVTEGFIGSAPDGRTTTLGFEGSDFTAALLGYALSEQGHDVQRVDIWTDVRGVYGADPNSVPEALFFEFLSYDQMSLLASKGGKVLHARTLEPLIRKKIPLCVRSSLTPDILGTLIYERPNPHFWAVTAVTSPKPFINCLHCPSSIVEEWCLEEGISSKACVVSPPVISLEVDSVTPPMINSLYCRILRELSRGL